MQLRIMWFRPDFFVAGGLIYTSIEPWASSSAVMKQSSSMEVSWAMPIYAGKGLTHGFNMYRIKINWYSRHDFNSGRGNIGRG